MGIDRDTGWYIHAGPTYNPILFLDSRVPISWIDNNHGCKIYYWGLLTISRGKKSLNCISLLFPPTVSWGNQHVSNFSKAGRPSSSISVYTLHPPFPPFSPLFVPPRLSFSVTRTFFAGKKRRKRAICQIDAKGFSWKTEKNAHFPPEKRKKRKRNVFCANSRISFFPRCLLASAAFYTFQREFFFLAEAWKKKFASSSLGP